MGHTRNGYLRRTGAWVENLFSKTAISRGLYSIAHGMTRDDVAVHASAMTFDLFLSLIPMLALSGWLLTLLLQSNPAALGYVSRLLDVTPYQVHQVMEVQFGRFAAGVAPFAVLIALYLASGAFHTAMNVFEHATGAKRRTWWTKRAIALGCVLAAIMTLALTGLVGVVLSGGPTRTVQALLGPDTVPGLARYVTYSLAFVSSTAFLAGFFRIAIHHPDLKRHVWPGALATVGMGAMISWGFAMYLQTLARYTIYYGSLATVAVTLVWLYLWCVALLLGVELNAQLENHDRRRLPRASVPPWMLISDDPLPPEF
jgi:membrane protein